MECVKLFMIFLLNPVLGVDMNAIDLSIAYLKYREVKLICLLSCENQGFWDVQFTKQASEHSMFVSKVMIDDDDVIITDDNTISSCLSQRFTDVGVVVERGCENFEQIMYFASQNKYLDANRKWIVIANENSTNAENNITTAEIFGQLNISVDADVLLARKNENFTNSLYAIFNFGKIQGGDLIVDEVGSWNIGGLRLVKDLNRYKYYRRWNFRGWPMRMALVATSASGVNLKALAEIKPVPGVAMITQSSIAALLEVAEIHNFRYIQTIADRWVAKFDRNGTKTVTNMVYFEEQDISPVIRFLIDIHEKLDTLSSPLSYIETKYYYRIPTFGPGKFENQFLRPLSNGAWWGLVAVSVLCALLLLLSARLEKRPTSAQYAVFSVIASICQQFFQDIDDSGIRKESSARKLSVLVTGISCVLVYNYYTSSVVSWLLNGPPPSINSLQELLDSPLELIYEDIGYTRSWLQTPKYYYNKANAKVEDEIRKKKVLNKKKDAPLLVPLEKGIRMVKNGGYAYHTETCNANEVISRSFTQIELCEMGSLYSIPKTDLYAFVQKKSPYKEFMSWSIMRLTERGIVSRIHRRTRFPEVSCEGSSPRALALGGAAPAFILLTAGYLLATVIMVIERYTYKLKNSA